MIARTGKDVGEERLVLGAQTWAASMESLRQFPGSGEHIYLHSVPETLSQPCLLLLCSQQSEIRNSLGATVDE